MTPPLLLAFVIAAAPDGLAFAGDTFVAHTQQQQQQQRQQQQQQPQRARVADGLVVNHEGSVCEGVAAGGRRDQDRWRLCTSRDAPNVLRSLGVIAAGLENNHADDGNKRATATGLQRAGIAPIMSDRPFCARGLCVVAWHDGRADLPAALARVRELAQGSPVVALVHLSRDSGRRVLNAFADAGALVVIGSGSHQVKPIRARGRALIFDDVGDLVVDCACSTGAFGLVVHVPATAEGAVVVRVVRAAHDAGQVIGLPAPSAQLARLVHESERDGARVLEASIVDGALELQRPNAQQAP